MAKPRLVVIGGDAAGMSAASVVRRRRPDMDVVVFEKGAFTSYAACGIPYYAGGQVADSAMLIARSPDEFRKAGIDVRMRTEVLAIDLVARRVRFRLPDDAGENSEPFDQLLIATGARPIVPPIPGVEATGVHSISGLQSGLDLRRELDAHGQGAAVVVGGGYIGIEMAEALRMRGCPVTLVEQASQVLLTLDADMASGVADRLVAKGITLHLGEALTSIQTDASGRVQAVVTEGRTIPAGLVVLAIGIRPNTLLARDAGITLGERGAIHVDDRMQTSEQGIWAAGDCAESWHRVSERPTWVALGTVANKHGRVAGLGIAGGEARFPGVVGTAITSFYDLEVSRTGLSERECEALNIPCTSVTIDARTRAHYYPGQTPMRVKMLAAPETGRLLGAQITGGPGAGKRIDVVATALHTQQSVGDLLDLDLAYAPPFSPVWDPVQTAARVLIGKLGRE